MADEARAQRQKALAEKRKRLDELRARREQRATQAATNAANSTATRGLSTNIEEYIDGLLKTPTSAAATETSTQSEAAATSTAAVAATAASTTVNGGKDASQPAGATPNNVIAEAAPAPPAAPVKQVETFEAGTQTFEDDFPPSSETDDDDLVANQSDDEIILTSNDMLDSSNKPALEEDEEVVAAKILTAEEMEREVTSQTFASFLNTASKKVERVLGSPMLADLLYDVVGDTDSKRSETKASDGSKFLSSRQIYECPKWTANRDVTDVDWSPLHRELMLTSYHMPSSSASLGQPVGASAVKAVSSDDTPSSSLAPRSGELLSDGLALIWSLAMPNRPEHIFTCGSPVTTARFHPTESPLVIGGCQSGQVVVWDVRAGRMPVQKSSLTTTASGGKGHTHPICSMEYIEGGAGLVTGASDGRINFWSLANLRDPAESLQVGTSVSCLSVSPESETLVCGDETGTLFAVQSSQTSLGGGGGGQRSRRQVRKIDAGTEAHFGMITSICTKTQRAAGRAGISKGFLRGAGGLFLTAGVDWTVKLWSPAYTDKPLLSLVSHSYDYMSDVQWSPAHPSLCATASSNGTICLWNFASSLEEPITGFDGIVVEPDGGSGRGLNKLKWSQDGRRMIVASADRVHVLSLAEDVVRQKGDESEKIMSHFQSRGLLDRE